MTQSDGELPTVEELRGVLGRAKIEWADYEKSVISAVAGWDKVAPARRWEIMANLSDKHASLVAHMHAVHALLGLPYDTVIDVVEVDVDVFAVPA